MNQKNPLGAAPQCDPAAVVQGDQYRITVLTPYLLRLEYSENGTFEDRPTQSVLNRTFPVPAYHVTRKDGMLSLETEGLRLLYDQKPFSRSGLFIRLTSGAVWRFGDEPDDLGGTARTLDQADGAIPLGHGLISRGGYSLVDDSRSMALTEDGWVEPRPEGAVDLYFFGYGHAYARCVQDFYRLCGKTPLLPRWAFGNWWSRYYPYSADSYQALVERFAREKIPFSVAVLDMDWHLVDEVDPKYGSGWTGYTWNRRLFPEPKTFMAWLHAHGLKITLSVHPADGVRAFEKPYAAIAKEMGVDVVREEPVDFDVADPHFMQAYFQYLHHPLEDEGVDFWWIDWQQGSVCRIPGLDPLWMLNHYHFLDSQRRKTRPVIFSRYAGVGSHRYPIGFSGDTVVTWDSLRFQPYFTATASNIGYGWWSHDIGGHMNGYKNDELAARWVQFGVFSPIMRLHSTSNRFNSKEPWRFGPAAEAVMKRFLRLRHALVPYLYTMNRYASRDGLPLIRPMYWLAPERPEAYEVPNAYAFGTELIAAPITAPADASARLAEAKAWMPDGLWFDFFSGHVYRGGRMRSLWRPLETMPVLAKAGAIVPLTDRTGETNSVANPSRLEVRVFPGADGRFTLWEDAGDTPEDRDENWAGTELELKYGQAPAFFVRPAQGNTSVLPQKRSWRICFCGVKPAAAAVEIDGQPAPAETAYDETTHTLCVCVPETAVSASLCIRLPALPVAENDAAAEVYRLLDRAQIEFDVKAAVQGLVERYGSGALPELETMGLGRPLFSALSEILLP